MTKPGTPLPWAWVDEDHSALILGNTDDYVTHGVMWVSPCEACQGRNSTKEWEWGACTTPSKQDAAYIVHACNDYPRLAALNAELVGALETMTEFAEGVIRAAQLKDKNGICAGSRALLAKARGETV